MMTGDKLNVNGDKWQPRDGVLRFEVSRGPDHVEAFISRSTCQASDGGLGGGPGGDHSLAEFVRQHRSQLDRIVLGKLSAGARHPVVVMARDLWPPLMPDIGPAAPAPSRAPAVAVGEPAVEQAQPA